MNPFSNINKLNSNHKITRRKYNFITNKSIKFLGIFPLSRILTFLIRIFNQINRIQNFSNNNKTRKQKDNKIRKLIIFNKLAKNQINKSISNPESLQILHNDKHFNIKISTIINIQNTFAEILILNILKIKFQRYRHYYNN